MVQEENEFNNVIVEMIRHYIGFHESFDGSIVDYFKNKPSGEFGRIVQNYHPIYFSHNGHARNPNILNLTTMVLVELSQELRDQYISEIYCKYPDRFTVRELSKFKFLLQNFKPIDNTDPFLYSCLTKQSDKQLFYLNLGYRTQFNLENIAILRPPTAKVYNYNLLA